MLVGMKILANSLVDEHIRYIETDAFRTRTCLREIHWSFRGASGL